MADCRLRGGRGNEEGRGGMDGREGEREIACKEALGAAGKARSLGFAKGLEA